MKSWSHQTWESDLVRIDSILIDTFGKEIFNIFKHTFDGHIDYTISKLNRVRTLDLSDTGLEAKLKTARDLSEVKCSACERDSRSSRYRQLESVTHMITKKVYDTLIAKDPVVSQALIKYDEMPKNQKYLVFADSLMVNLNDIDIHIDAFTCRTYFGKVTTKIEDRDLIERSFNENFAKIADAIADKLLAKNIYCRLIIADFCEESVSNLLGTVTYTLVADIDLVSAIDSRHDI